MKNISLPIIALLIFNSFVFACGPAAAASAQQAQSTETPQAARIRGQVQNRGEKSRVKVRLTNGTVVDGTIGKIDDSSFEVWTKNSGQATAISYADVQEVRGPGMSRGKKIGIGVGIGIGVVVIVLVVGLVELGPGLR